MAVGENGLRHRLGINAGEQMEQARPWVGQGLCRLCHGEESGYITGHECLYRAGFPTRPGDLRPQPGDAR